MLRSVSSLPYLRIAPLTIKHFEQAEEVVSEEELNLEDAIHFVVAREYHCELIYSNDSDFDKVALKRKF